jgi:hypothetical protein
LKILTLTLAATLATDATAADTTGNSMLEPCEHYLSNTNANDLMLQGMCVGVVETIRLGKRTDMSVRHRKQNSAKPSGS